jgi:glycosyltransferase involved in cell wall biosynthesis
MEKLIICYTPAWNSEKTIARAMNSIINQTYENWLYYVDDNGSTDGTLEIARKIAEKDSRIIVTHKDVNPGCVVLLPFFRDVLLPQFSDDVYFCELDDDDQYKPEFFEKTLSFAEENRLDIAYCGVEALLNGDGRLFWRRVLPKDLVLKSPKIIIEHLVSCFSQYRTC